MAALPIDQSEMVSESQLSELAQVLTVGILENDVLLFADYQMEMMREALPSFCKEFTSIPSRTVKIWPEQCVPSAC